VSGARIALTLLLAGFAVRAGDAAAATFPDLYRVTVKPDPAAADRRRAAIGTAMAQLLVRVTGRRDAAADPALEPLIADADSYRQSYGLDRQGRAQVGFVASRVEQALTSLNMPVWGAERPLTVVWLAVDDGAGNRALLGANDDAESTGATTPEMNEQLAMLRTALTAAAGERGLPIALPLLDLEDLTAVTFADVWGGFDDRIVAASTRYRADAVLIGRLRPGFVGPAVQWLLVAGGERRALAGVELRDGIDAAADKFASELATVGGLRSALLTVRDVATPTDYGRVISYLERQSVLQSVDVDGMENGVLTVRVASRGDEQVLQRILSLGSVLRPAGNGFGGALVFEVARAGVGP
jgi:uncharacterized protein